MSIILNVDGPKGSGKSTVTKILAEQLNATVKHFNSDVVVSEADFSLDGDYIFERGVMSFQVYDWLWNNDVSARFEEDFSKHYVTIKRPMNKQHYDRLMLELTGKLVIFYSSDPDLLVERITKRARTENKGADDLEWRTLKWSNEYFKFFGQFLKSIYPEKVLLIDVAKPKFDNPTKTAMYILNELKA